MLSFGTHGRQEHHGMKIDYLTMKKIDEGVEFVPFTEGPKKTRQGGL